MSALKLNMVKGSVSDGAHSVPKPFNKLIHVANKINQFSVFNKINLWFMIQKKLFL